MPRQRTEKVKDSTTYRYCSYCKANRNKRRFDKHQAACKIIWQQQRHRRQKLQLLSKPINEQTERKIDNSMIKVNFILPTYATIVVTRNNLKDSDGPQVLLDGDVSIPDSFEEMAMAACETVTAEQCKYFLLLIYLSSNM